MKILTFTSLYPSSARPQHGVFVENRLRQLVGTGAISARVVAPVPWFPISGKLFGPYGRFAATPPFEDRYGLAIDHPRYPVIPKVGMNIAPDLLFSAAKRAISRNIEKYGEFDIIDSHYFYPDGVAATKLGAYFGKPVVITGRGTDINLFPEFTGPRRRIIQAGADAAALITVSQSLKDRLIDLGVDGSKITVLRNGVDLTLFRPVDANELRPKLLGARHVIASVGNLIPLKGHDIVIRALNDLPDFELVIVGQGEDYGRLRKLSRDLGVADRVLFLGSIPHEQMPEVYSMADALVLASSREGWANVLLESMACGTPVAATNVSGTPEVVTTPEAGVLIEERSPDGISSALTRLFNDMPKREDTRAHAEKFSWEETTQGQLELFNSILSRTL